MDNYFNSKDILDKAIRTDTYFQIKSILFSLKAADVAPVQHGQWLPQIVLGEKAWDCSECKTLGSPHWKWCPMCGCRMNDEATSTCHNGVCEIPGVE